MLGKNKIKKTLSVFCAFCLIFQLLVGSISALADENTVQDEIIAEQNETVLGEEVQENTQAEEETSPDQDSLINDDTEQEANNSSEFKKPMLAQTSQNGGTLNEDGAYVDSLSVVGMTTGTAPFDDDDNPGNDSSVDNKIVRSFDSVTYNVNYVTKYYDVQSFYDQGYIMFRFELPCDSSVATFDADAMGWIKSAPEYYNVTKENGKQILTCAKLLRSNGSDNNVIPGSGSINVNVKIWGAKNGDQIQPTFYSWMDHNQCSDYAWFSSGDKIHPDNEEVKTVQPEAVTVSAAPRFNVKFQKVVDEHCSAQSTFDFSTGNDKALNKDKGQVKGVLTCYGVTLQMYGDSEKGLRGVEYPSGPITLDLDLGASYKYKDENDQDQTLSVSSLIWSAEGNAGGETQSDSRDVNTYATPYAAGVAPYNKDSEATIDSDLGTKGSQSCFNGGDWSFSQDDTGKVHVTVDNYQINPNWFPNVNSYQPLDNKIYYYNKEAGVKSCWQACFSAAEVFVVTPTEEFENLGDKWNGILSLNAKDTTLKVETASGQVQQDSDNTNDKQKVTTDDEAKGTADTNKREGADTSIQYAFPGQGVNYTADINNWQNGPFNINQKDATSLGEAAAIQVTFTGSPNGIEENNWAAVDVLVKFDDGALVPNDTNPYLSWSGQKEGEEVTRVFAYKTDGSGWTSDEQQGNAKIEDLVYYNDYSEDYGVCVGILAQLTCPTNSGFKSKDMSMKYYFNVKTDKALIGHVAQTTVCARYATHATLQDPANRTTVTDVTNQTATWDTYCSQVPNMKGPAYNVDGATFRKAEYSASGTLINEGTGHKKYCDSLYLSAYKTAIEKTVSQKADSHDHNPQPKTIFNHDLGEDTVDFCLIPTVSIAQALEWSDRETLVIRDTVPKDMSYVEESAVVGGEYQPNATTGLSGDIYGGVKCHKDAKVSYQVESDEEKISVYFRVVNKDNGTAVLEWTLQNVDIYKPIPQIHYKAIFADNVTNNQNFKNTAVIFSENDHRLIDISNGNLDEYTVSVALTSDFSIKQTVSPRVAEVNSPITYNISYNNNSPNNYDNNIMMTTLPHKEGSAGRLSSYSGDYKVTDYGFKPQEGTTISDYTVWYTTYENAYSLTSENVSADEIRTLGLSGLVQWTGATISESADGDGMYYLTDLPDNATAIVIIAPFKPNKSVLAKVVIEPSGNHPGDVYWNNASFSNGTGTSRVDTAAYIVKRTVSGRVWYDTNRNGLQDEDEQPVTDIALKATLYSADDLDTPASKVYDSEEKLEVIVDENGEYLFEDMAEGEYIVKFTAVDGNIVSDKGLVKVTVQDAENNNNDEKDCDAQGSYDSNNELESATTSTFTLPSKEEIVDSGNHLFELYNVDLGLYIAKNIDITEKVNGAEHADLSERYTEFTYTINTSVPDELDVMSFVVNDTLEDVLEYVQNSVTVTIGETQLTAEQIQNQLTINSQTLSFALTAEQIGQMGEDITITFNAKISEGADLSAYLDNGKIKIPNSSSFIINSDSGRTKNSNVVTVTPPDPSTINILVTKEWVGPEQDSVTVYLLADGVENDSVELKASTNWQHTFENKPEYDIKTGKKIEYTIKEKELENYSSDIVKNDDGSFTITNTNTETIDIPVTKVWVCPEDEWAESVTIQLFANNVDTEKEVFLNEGNTWHNTFEKLPKYDSKGVAIDYTVKEVKVDGYSTEITGNMQDGFVITNTKLTTFDVTKIWRVDSTTILPQSISVQLIRNGEYYREPVQLKAEDGWKYTFEDLPKYDAENNLYIYSVSELSVEGYISYMTQQEGSNKATITNVITTNAEVKKVWRDNNDAYGTRPGSVTVQLYQTIGGITSKVDDEALTLSGEGNVWSGSIGNLPKYTKDGVEIKYSFKEIDLSNNYKPSVSDDGLTITNTITGKVSIPVTKVWKAPEDKWAESVTIKLFANDVYTEKEVVLNEYNSWHDTFKDLEKYDSNGVEINYTVKEDSIDSYLTNITGDMENGFVVTNTITGKVSIPVTKAWVGPAAKSVTVELFADGEKLTQTELNEGNSWQYTFADLEKYKDGKEIEYTIKEQELENYSSDIVKNDDGSFTITNTNTAKRNITVEKKWVGKELSEVTIHLFADGKEVDSAKLTKDTAWKHSFTDLAQFDQKDGHEIKYTISEDAVTGYTTSITGSAEEGFTVTNTEQEKPTEAPTQAPTQAPKVVTPKTSDNSNTVLYAWFTALSAVALVLCLGYRKKSRKKACKVENKTK